MCDFSEIPTANRVKLLIDCGGNSLGKLTEFSEWLPCAAQEGRAVEINWLIHLTFSGSPETYFPPVKILLNNKVLQDGDPYELTFSISHKNTLDVYPSHLREYVF